MKISKNIMNKGKVTILYFILVFLLANVVIYWSVISSEKEYTIRLLHSREILKDNDFVAEPVNCLPSQHRYFPLCTEQIVRINMSWRESYCLREIYRINGSQCSIYDYLTKVEPLCVGNKELYIRHRKLHTTIRYELDGLMDFLAGEHYAWIRKRIKWLWPRWVKGAKNFSARKLGLKTRNVIVYMAALWYQPQVFNAAFYGGPVGELVQWTDLITSLYVLGYNIILIKSAKEISRYTTVIDNNKCPVKTKNDSIDIIYTDYVGTYFISTEYGFDAMKKFNCKFRLLDSFGTYPEFNYDLYPYLKDKTFYGGKNLILKQYLTLYPHTHDNSFLGFVVSAIEKNNSVSLKRQDIALVYGKDCNYLTGHERYLHLVSEYFDVHATCVDIHTKTNLSAMPFKIVNHAIISSSKLQQLLSKSKLFIGLGFPYEGPGPLEAMAAGAVFLQPKFVIPMDKTNTKFFAGKPTLRSLHSQSPYMEEHIGEPYCYTINVTDEPLLRKVLARIKHMHPLPGRIPKEFTPSGLLERVFVFNERMDFCNPYTPKWPPLSHLQVLYGNPGKSCTDTCMANGFVCEPSYFEDINSVAFIERFGRIKCANISREKYLLHPPSIKPLINTCYLQTHGLLFSCSHQMKGVKRLCPCRNYEFEQTTICKGCL